MAGLSPDKRELLAKLLSEKRADPAHPSVIPRRQPSAVIPLSFAQQRIWILEQLLPGSCLYNESATFRLSFPLDPAALERSVNEIVRRHEIFRTTFHSVEGQPVQVITPTLTVPLLVSNLSGLPKSERETEALRLAKEDAQRPFNLERGPLLRTALMRLGEQDHFFLLTIHHIVYDGWSAGVFLLELTALYGAFSAGRPSPLPELPVQYADFAAWQRQWLQGHVLESQLAYWKRCLENLTALQLPTDRPRPILASFRGARQLVVIPSPLEATLKAISQREGVTLYMTLLAAFQVLLHRYTGQDDIVVGSPVANRNQPELAGLIGFFVNTLVIRTDLSGDPSFREVLGRVREVTLGAYAHQDLPFEKLVEELQPERDASRNPLFQVSFQLFSALASPALPDIPPVNSVETGTAKFDLRFDLIETSQGLRGYLDYSTDLFDGATIGRMVGHFQNLLEGIAANPEQRISRLPLLTEEERQNLVVAWNETACEYPRDSCIQELFEQQVERRPEATAVVFGEQQLTYGELNWRANQLAHYLVGRGVGPDVVVAVALPRSLEMVVGLLGVLKAGGAYLPLDPGYPKERLRLMVEGTQARLLLGERGLLPDLTPGELEVVDLTEEEIHRQAGHNPVCRSRADNLAYVMYTSGSTGKPKGVCIVHRGVVRLVVNSSYVEIRGEDVFLQLAPISFDASTFEIWGSLLNGARLVVYPQEIPVLEDLGQAIQRHGVTTLWLTAGLFHQMVEGQLESLGRVRQLLAGGDVLSVAHVRRAVEGLPDCRLINGYGPTENTTFTCTHWIAEAGRLGPSVPIGRPISNTRVYVLDRYRNPVPVGVAGELYLGGDGLARGYWNQPDLTSEKFVSNPFSSHSGERLYRSGDLVRYRADGSLEFLGRQDYQVKIRGFRVELGEVESVLSEHPAIGECVVQAREEVAGHKQLVAYVGVQPQMSVSVSDLRSFVRERLPEYMVPSAFVLLEALPRNPNGKLDRGALEAFQHSRLELKKEFEAPRSSVEQRLSEIWSEILGVKPVGIHDNFFELGGDSILSIQVIARAKRVGLQFTPRQFFQHQTIAGLAAVAETIPTAQVEPGLMTGSSPLTPIQFWFFEQNLIDPQHYNQAILLDVRQALDPDLLAKAVEYLLVHHDALRLRFEPQERGWHQFYAIPSEAAPFGRVEFSGLSQTEQKETIEVKAAEVQASLDFRQGPLLRVVLFELGAFQSSRLLIVIHHLVVDVVSWQILLEDLWTGYHQLKEGQRIQLPPKTTPFSSWARRLKEQAQSASLREELTQWLAVSAHGAGRLPVDFSRAANTVASCGIVSIRLSRTETQDLLQEVPKAYRTQINEVLLTALVQAFGRWTGKARLLIDLEGHGREALFEDVDLSRTVGWFTTIFPVWLDLEGVRDAGEALKSIKAQLRRIPNKGIGYGMLRYLSEDAEIEEKMRAVPRADVSFNYLGQWAEKESDPASVELAVESSGPTRSPRASRSYLLEIDGSCIQGQLTLNWTYSETVHRRSTVESLAQDFATELRSLIDHCRSPETGGYAPSDFSRSKLSKKDLDRLAAKLSQPSKRPLQ